MSEARRVVVVGASAAGCAVVTELVRSGADLDISVVSAERGLPYDRPPLSKQYLLGQWTAERVALRVDLSHDRITHHAGDPAVRLDVDAREVHLDSGAVLPFDDVVITTGSHPRRLPALDQAGALVLRTLSDSATLRAALASAGRVTIVGGGFIGLEVASACRSTGIDVTIVEPDPDALARRVGRVVADRLIELHEKSGVEFVWGSRPLADEPVDARGRLRLEDGRVVPGAPILVAVGSQPSTAWLAGSGIEVVDGVDCDDHGRAADGVWAAGDVARWWHPRYARPLRLEHRQNATDQGRTVAHNIVGGDEAWDAVPFFWTDQVNAKIQAAGLVDPGHIAEVVEGDVDSGSFVLSFHGDGTPAAVVGWNAAARMAHYRRELALAC